MEQEFSWSGLVISLSIAFFIVMVSAQGLNIAYQSLEETGLRKSFTDQSIYYLESSQGINSNIKETTRKFFQAKVASASEMSIQEILEYPYFQISSR